MSSTSIPYPRENYFDSQSSEDYTLEADTTKSDDDTDGDGGASLGVSRAEWIAHSILRETATMVCPVSLYEDPDCDGALHDENESIELTDPLVHVPKTAERSHGEIDYGQRRHRTRYNPIYGYLDAGVVIEDQPLEDFLTVTEAVIQTQNLPERVQKIVQRHARDLKRTGNMRDIDILTEVVRALDHPSSPLDYLEDEP